jgi:hypothetical protein
MHRVQISITHTPHHRRATQRTGQRGETVQGPEAVEREKEHAELGQGREALQRLESVGAQVQVPQAGEGAVGAAEGAEGVGGEVERDEPWEQQQAVPAWVSRLWEGAEARQAVGVEVDGPVGFGLWRGVQ